MQEVKDMERYFTQSEIEEKEIAMSHSPASPNQPFLSEEPKESASNEKPKHALVFATQNLQNNFQNSTLLVTKKYSYVPAAQVFSPPGTSTNNYFYQNLPGGKVEPPEMIIECAMRELLEETNLHGLFPQIKGTLIFPNLIIYIVSTSVQSSITPRSNTKEVYSVKWTPIRDITRFNKAQTPLDLNVIIPLCLCDVGYWELKYPNPSTMLQSSVTPTLPTDFLLTVSRDQEDHKSTQRINDN